MKNTKFEYGFWAFAATAEASSRNKAEALKKFSMLGTSGTEKV